MRTSKQLDLTALFTGAVAAAAALALTACPALDLSPNHYACDRAAEGPGCPGGWHCGVEGYCYDPSSAGAVKCEPDRGDCAEDWTCGVDLVCHPAEPGAWACTEDAHCFGWRCGLDGKCIDPAREALPFAAFPSPVEGVLENPRLLRGAPRGFVAGTPQDIDVSTKDRWRLLPTALLRDAPDGGAELVHLLRVQREDPSTQAREVAMWPHVQPLDTEPVDFAPSAWRLFWLEGTPGDRSLKSVRRLQDGGVEALAPVSVTGDALRLLEADDAASAFTFTPGTEEATFVRPLGPPLEVRAPETKRDPAGAPASVFEDATYLRGLIGGGAVVVATGRALYRVNTFLGYPESANGEPTWCEGSEDTAAAIFDSTTSPSGQAPRFELRARTAKHLFDVTQLAVQRIQPNDFGGGLTPGARELFLLAGAGGTCSGLPDDVVLGPCRDPCADLSLELVDFRPAYPAIGAHRLEVRCGLPGPGGLDRHLLLRAGGFGQEACVAETVDKSPLAGDRFLGAHHPHTAAFLGAHGQLFAGETGLTASPSTLAAAPLGLLSSGALAVGVLPQAVALPQEDGFGWVVTPQSLSEPIQAVVPGRPWLVFGSGYVLSVGAQTADGGTVLPVAASAAPLELPITTAALPRADGGTHLVLASFDQLLAATVTGEPSTEPAPLEVRLVPFPRTPIVGVAPLRTASAPDGGAALSAGYVATQSRAFRFHAETDRRWRIAELPAPDGEILSVWTDPADRGRLGLRDGTVVSLPSGLVLSASLEDDGPAFDFADVCGQPWVLARGGLFRLRQEGGGPVGAWEQVPLSGPSAAPGGGGPGAGRLFTHPAGLHVFTARGEVERFPLSCLEEAAP